MKEAVNMLKLAAELAKRPRGRACIVLTHDYAGQRPWAAELAKQTGAEHLDFLEVFSQKPDLAAQASTFGAAQLFDFLENQKNYRLLIVSGIEFLKAIWSANPNEISYFGHRVETWSKSPALLFLIQFDPALAEMKFTRFRQHTFLVDQRDTLAL